MFKKVFYLMSMLALLGCLSLQANQTKVGIVSVYECAKQTKLSKVEQENLQKMKQQFENQFTEKEKERNELAKQFEDPNFLDGLTPDKEKELNEQLQKMNQELMMMEGQFSQTINMAYNQFVTLINYAIKQACEKIAQEEQLDLVQRSDNLFYFQNYLDLTSKVVVEMDKQYDEQGLEGFKSALNEASKENPLDSVQ